FDWPDTEGVLDKIAEEARELAEAPDPDAREAEMGDLLFALANLARRLGIDPEAALRRTNTKFIRRFNAVEDGLQARGKTPAESDLAEMDALWNRIRAAESGG